MILPLNQHLVSTIHSIKAAKEPEVIYKIVSAAFDEEFKFKDKRLLTDLLSAEDQAGNRVKKLIPQKLSEMENGGMKGKKTLDRINLLIRYLIKKSSDSSLKELCFSSSERSHGIERSSLSWWIKDSKKPDLSDQELEELIEEFNHPHPYRCLNQFLNEFSRLSRFQANDPVNHEAISKKYRHLSSLIEYANEVNKPNILKYLIKIRENINEVNRDYKSPLLKELDAIIQKKERPFLILSCLLDNRKPIQKIDLLKVLHFCFCKYKREPENFEYNRRLLDHAVSILLGKKILIEDYFKEKQHHKLIAHILEMEGKSDAGKEEEAFELEGMDRHHYLQLCLRLQLEIIVKDVIEQHSSQKSQQYKGLTEKELLDVYNEILSEIETAWLSELLESWENSKLSKNIKKNRRIL